MPIKQDVNKKLGERLQKFLEDVATLDVLTLSGTIALENADSNKNDKKPEDVINWDSLFKKVTDGMKPDAANKLEVVAYTHAEWDCDSVNFVKNDASPAVQALVENHRQAVEAAHRSRYEALKFIGNVIGGLVD